MPVPDRWPTSRPHRFQSRIRAVSDSLFWPLFPLCPTLQIVAFLSGVQIVSSYHSDLRVELSQHDSNHAILDSLLNGLHGQNRRMRIDCAVTDLQGEAFPTSASACRTNLFVAVEAKRKIRPSRSFELAVRSNLLL